MSKKYTVIVFNPSGKEYGHKYEITGRLAISDGRIYTIIEDTGKKFYFPVALTIIIETD